MCPGNHAAVARASLPAGWRCTWASCGTGRRCRMSGTRELGDQVVPYLANHDALLLANHGAVTMGGTLDEAWIRMESLEHGARIIMAARHIGQPQPLSPDADRVLEQQREKDA